MGEDLKISLSYTATIIISAGRTAKTNITSVVVKYFVEGCWTA